MWTDSCQSENTTENARGGICTPHHIADLDWLFIEWRTILKRWTQAFQMSEPIMNVKLRTFSTNDLISLQWTFITLMSWLKLNY